MPTEGMHGETINGVIAVEHNRNAHAVYLKPGTPPVEVAAGPRTLTATFSTPLGWCRGHYVDGAWLWIASMEVAP
jgi:hypothetical protein